MAKKRLTAHQKAEKHYLNIIARAKARLAQAASIQNRLRKTGTLSQGIDLARAHHFIQEAENYISSGKRFTKKTQKTMEAIRERANPTYYTQLIKWTETITQKKGPVEIPAGTAEHKVSDTLKLMKRSNLTKQEYDTVSAYSLVMNPVHQAYAQADTTALRNALSKKRVRDTGFGGDSMLLNDLAYSAGANPLGSEMVTYIQGLMSNPEYFNAIETMYRTEGQDIKRQLDQAVGSDWYDEFRTAIQAIIELIVKIKTNVNLSDEEQDALGNLLARYEGEAEEYEKS